MEQRLSLVTLGVEDLERSILFYRALGWEPEVKLKDGLARMLVGGVIMDVTTAEQARIAEEAGAVAVMALERVPSQIRK